jgi:ATP phosphoribosyltransferase
MLRLGGIFLAGSLLIVSSAAAQQPEKNRTDSVSQRMSGPHHGDQAMMMKMMEASDARLDQLVQTMNRSTGQKKVDAMAAVINELITQRKQMRGHMRQMMHPSGPAPQ